MGSICGCSLLYQRSSLGEHQLKVSIARLLCAGLFALALTACNPSSETDTQNNNSIQRIFDDPVFALQAREMLRLTNYVESVDLELQTADLPAGYYTAVLPTDSLPDLQQGRLDRTASMVVGDVTLPLASKPGDLVSMERGWSFLLSKDLRWSKGLRLGKFKTVTAQITNTFESLDILLKRTYTDAKLEIHSGDSLIHSAQLEGQQAISIPPGVLPVGRQELRLRTVASGSNPPEVVHVSGIFICHQDRLIIKSDLAGTHAQYSYFSTPGILGTVLDRIMSSGPRPASLLKSDPYFKPPYYDLSGLHQRLQRSMLMLSGDSFTYPYTVPESSAIFRFAYGYDIGGMPANAVLSIEIQSQVDASLKRMLTYRLGGIEQRSWYDAEIDLEAFAGQAVGGGDEIGLLRDRMLWTLGLRLPLEETVGDDQAAPLFEGVAERRLVCNRLRPGVDHLEIIHLGLGFE